MKFKLAKVVILAAITAFVATGHVQVYGSRYTNAYITLDKTTAAVSLCQGAHAWVIQEGPC